MLGKGTFILNGCCHEPTCAIIPQSLTVSKWIAHSTIGLPVLSYKDDTHTNLKVVHCGNAACTSGNTVITEDSAGLTGFNISITIGTDGLPIVSYLDLTNNDLKILKAGSIIGLSNWVRR